MSMVFNTARLSRYCFVTQNSILFLRSYLHSYMRYGDLAATQTQYNHSAVYTRTEQSEIPNLNRESTHTSKEDHPKRQKRMDSI